MEISVSNENDEDEIVQYWMKYYVQNNHCSLCGNVGLIDSRSSVTPAGFFCGRVNFCICPNGQALRRSGGDPEIHLLRYRERVNEMIMNRYDPTDRL